MKTFQPYSENQNEVTHRAFMGEQFETTVSGNLDIKTNDCILQVYQHLLIQKEKHNQWESKGRNLSTTFQQLLYQAFDFDALLKLSASHIVAKQALTFLIKEEDYPKLFHDAIYKELNLYTSYLFADQKFILTDFINDIEKVSAQMIDPFVLLDVLLNVVPSKNIPSYFRGVINSLFLQYFGDQKLHHAHLMYPAFNMPPFFQAQDSRESFICQDLLIYYWTLIKFPERISVFGNALSYYQFGSNANQIELFSDNHPSLQKFKELNKEKVNALFGTLSQLKSWNRSANNQLVKDVKKYFGDALKRNPLSFWLLWAKMRLENEGILILRGDDSLANSLEDKLWREQAKKVCASIYVQADPASDLILYFFVFSSKGGNHQVSFSPSHFDDFDVLPDESQNWAARIHEDYADFIPLFSETETSVFISSEKGINLASNSWLTDSDQKRLLTKVNEYAQIRSQEQKSLVTKEEKVAIKADKLKRMTFKPFHKKWCYVEPIWSKKVVQDIQRLGEGKGRISLLYTKGKEGVQFMPVEGLVMKDFFEKGQEGFIFPMAYSTKSGIELSNISEQVFRKFKRVYTKQFKNLAAGEIRKEDLKNIKRLLEDLSKRTYHFPVLQKYASEALQVIKTHQDAETLAEGITDVMQRLNDKLKILGKGASERKKQFEVIHSLIENIDQYVLSFDKPRRDAQEKIKGVSHENIFYYTMAILMHPEYQSKYQEELSAVIPRIPLLPDFWFWAEEGRKIAQLFLYKEAVKPADLQVQDEMKHSKTLKVVNGKEVHLGEGKIIDGFPEGIWEWKWGSKSIIDSYIKTFKERKPLDTRLQKYFQAEDWKRYTQEIIRSLQQIAGIYLELEKFYQIKMFVEAKPAVVLKKR